MKLVYDKAAVLRTLHHAAGPVIAVALLVFVNVGVVVGVNEFVGHAGRPATPARLTGAMTEHPGCLLHQLPDHFDDAGTLVRPISDAALTQGERACEELKPQQEALASAPLPAAPKR